MIVLGLTVLEDDGARHHLDFCSHVELGRCGQSLDVNTIEWIGLEVEISLKGMYF